MSPAQRMLLAGAAGHLVVAVGLAAGLIVLGLVRDATWPLLWGPLVGLGYAGVALRRPLRRFVALARPFPPAWRATLERYVRFYRLLDAEGRRRFEANVSLILADHDIEAVAGAPLDDEVRLLAVAGGAVLIHGRPGAALPTHRSILIYPDRFDDDYEVGDHGDVLGQVHRQGPILLSAGALKAGWASGQDGSNVSLHEFAHVLDLEDGFADGVPALGAGRVSAWDELVATELERVRRGRSALRPYAGTNEAELFAVAVEVFFERPKELERRHPQLFGALRSYFGVDPRAPG
ncbi:MAG: M90 family metallopeptidase [Sandaracinaceae bacterium]